MASTPSPPEHASEGDRRSQHVADGFEPLVERFRACFVEPGDGGGALCVRHHGEVVVDVWSGYSDVRARREWHGDTGAVSFSTTKGLTSTVVHRLVDRGVLDPALPVATWWPEFARHGKADVTLAEVLSHRAGLSGIRNLVRDPDELLDHRHVADLLAERRPSRLRGTPAYHGLTFGYLVAAVVERATGQDFRDVVDAELVRPLGLRTCAVGLRDTSVDVARLSPMPLPLGLSGGLLARAASATYVMRAFANALLVEGFEDLVNTDAFVRSVVPAASGVVSAHDLATIYAALAGGGQVDGVEFLSPATVTAAGRVQTREIDRVLGLPMRWRLGYHHAFTRGETLRRGFGHYGYGGSGGWADPDRDLAVAFTTNKLSALTTPVADRRLLAFSDDAVRLAGERDGVRAA